MPSLLDRGASGWPAALEDLETPPERLYGIGDLGALEASPGLAVAIVGTRGASAYGLRVAKALGAAFARSGAVVVSGMARGIDTAAHTGALEAGGKTVAVLGTGVDIAYPPTNRMLHKRIGEGGLLLSESEPGTPAYKGVFPRRNRIIAALAKATIVVEAGFKSGALQTASWATALGRLTAAVPGLIDDPRAAGANLLIRDGAHVITGVDDALGLLGLRPDGGEGRPELGAEEAEVWDALAGEPASVEWLVDRTGLDVRTVLSAIGRLEVLGLVARGMSGDVSRAVLVSAG